MKNLLKTYCSYHPDFLDTLNLFPENIKQKVLDNLQNTTSNATFRSTIAEIQFGLKFQNLGFKLDYEKKNYNNQTPDWTISYLNNKAICEVYRLGMSSKDQSRSDFKNQLIEKLQILPFNYFVKIIFLDEYFDSNDYNIDLIIREFSDWLKKTKKNIGDRIIINNNFLFKIVKIDFETNHIYCIGNVNFIDVKPEKITQFKHFKRDNEVSKKISKYDTLISKIKSPYFIAILIDIISGFNYNDFKGYFLGEEKEFLDFGTPIANSTQFKHLGETRTKLGIFYQNPQLSGLLILKGNEFNFLLNPMKDQAIYRKQNIIRTNKKH